MAVDELTAVLNRENQAMRLALERVVRGGEKCLKLGTDAECRLALEASVEIARAAMGKKDDLR